MNFLLRCRFIIPLAILLTAAVHLSLYGFRISNDGPSWIKVAEFFRTGAANPALISAHYTFSPVIPLIVLFLKNISQNYTAAYFILNMVSLTLSSYLLYRLTLNITAGREIALFATLLYIIDFHTQMLAFEIMPDLFTWTYMLLIFSISIRLYTNKSTQIYFEILLWSLLISLGILIKTNLGFFFFLYPIILYLRRDSKILKKLVISWAIVTILVGTYYLWIFQTSGYAFWETWTTNSRLLKHTLLDYVSSSTAAFLYSIPLCFLGLRRHLFNKYPLLVYSFFILTLLPVIIWPFVMSRFYFTLFWFILPFAANGLLIVYRRSSLLFVFTLVTLYFLNTGRIYMTFNGLNHLEFFQIIISQIIFKLSVLSG